jgi:hypothetical protein
MREFIVTTDALIAPGTDREAIKFDERTMPEPRISVALEPLRVANADQV